MFSFQPSSCFRVIRDHEIPRFTIDFFNHVTPQESSLNASKSDLTQAVAKVYIVALPLILCITVT